MGAALILLSPYIPMLFQGEEWGATAPFQYFVDFQNVPELAKAVATGRQQEFAAFGWQADAVADPTDLETFAKSKLDWSEINCPPHSQLLSWHRELIKLRGEISAFTDGRLDLVETQCDDAAHWLIVRRGPISIICNFHIEAQTIPVATIEQQQLLLASKEVGFSQHGVSIPAETVAICFQGDFKRRLEIDAAIPQRKERTPQRSYAN